MSRTDRDVTRVVRSWLEEGVTALPDRVLDAVLDQLPATPQRRSWWTAWRRPFMSNTIRIALAAAAAVVVAVVAISLLPPSGGVGGPPASASLSPSPTTTSQPSPTPMLSWEVHPMNGDYSIGRHSVTVDGVPFSFNVSERGWEPILGVSAPPGGVSLNKSFAGSQGAEGIIYWTGFPDGLHTDPCPGLLGLAVGASAADLAAAVATAPGTALLTGPLDVTVGGVAAKYVVVRILREDLGCDPGYFHAWEAVDGGALWLTTDVGDTIRVWIVDVDSTRLFIAGESHEGSGPLPEQEIQQIVDSIQFE